MVVKKTMQSFLGMQLVPGVDEPSTVQRYTLHTPVPTQDSVVETQARMLGWGAPPYPGALIPLDPRGGMESQWEADLGQSPAVPLVEPPMLLFRAATSTVHGRPVPLTEDPTSPPESLHYEELAQAYIQEVENSIALTSSAVGGSPLPGLTTAMAASADVRPSDTPFGLRSQPGRGEYTVWGPPVASYGRLLAEPHDLVGPVMTSYTDTMHRFYHAGAGLSYLERGETVEAVKDMKQRTLALCSNAHMEIHTMKGFSDLAKLQTASTLADFCEALKGKGDLHGNAVHALQTDLRGRLPIPGSTYSAQGQWWPNWLPAKNFRQSGSDAQVAGGLPVLVVHFRSDPAGTEFPSPGPRGSASVFIAVFLDHTPHLLDVLLPLDDDVVDNNPPMAKHLMRCVSSAAGLSHPWRRSLVRMDAEGCSTRMVWTNQDDQSTLLHDVIRTALEDTFIHCDFNYWKQEDDKKRRKISVSHIPWAAALFEMLTIDLMKLGMERLIVLGILWIGNQGAYGNHPITMFPEEWVSNAALLHSEDHAERTLPVMYFVDGVSRFQHIRVGVLLLRLGTSRSPPPFSRRSRITGGVFRGIPEQGTFNLNKLVDAMMPLPAVGIPMTSEEGALRLPPPVAVAQP